MRLKNKLCPKCSKREHRAALREAGRQRVANAHAAALCKLLAEAQPEKELRS